MKPKPLQASLPDHKQGKKHGERMSNGSVGRRETLLSAQVLATFKVVVGSSVVCASSYIQT